MDTTAHRPAAAPSPGRTLRALLPGLAAIAVQLAVIGAAPRCGATAGANAGVAVAAWWHVASLAALLLALWAVAGSWRVLQRADAAWRASAAGRDATTARFFALGAAVLAVALAAVVAMTWLALATLAC